MNNVSRASDPAELPVDDDTDETTSDELLELDADKLHEVAGGQSGMGHGNT